jgi:hypothetical protein
LVTITGKDQFMMPVPRPETGPEPVMELAHRSSRIG